ncbi:MAG: xanthine dehydrogenase family protein subunit M, partial [Betaproteobacteria bacterium]|nr:xanthine dehydrogenase family protein subunit M [Betaproteobacteria bacterium]
AVEASPRRIAAAEALLNGNKPSAALFEAAAAAAADDIEPLEQNADSVEFKRDIVRAVVARALAAAEGSHE